MKLKTLRNNIFIFLLLTSFITSSNAEEIFVSLKKNEVNVRYGPSFESDIKYVYKKINLPIKQIDKKENFRRIIDMKNNSGWIHVSQLKNNNSVISTDLKILFKKPSSFAKPIAQLKKGRLLIIKECKKKWCKVKTGKFTGWVDKKNLWGISE